MELGSYFCFCKNKQKIIMVACRFQQALSINNVFLCKESDERHPFLP
jgi:hypothetical protein